jgi:protein-L-isoaspartate(D-aspartate) O-methyltransferase
MSSSADPGAGDPGAGDPGAGDPEAGDPGAGLRAELVAHLRERAGLSDPRVAAVLGQVPRHVFVPGVELAEAYQDRPIVTHHRDGVPTSSSSQPAIVAAMLQQLRPPPGGSVLEIGAGTGYNAALLAGLVGPSGRVVTVDLDPGVADEARSHLSDAGVTNVEVICGDGALGWADGAPYDGIIVTAGASDLAPAWVGQLGPDGRLVLPLSIRGVQQSVAFMRAGGHLRSVEVCEGSFMPLEGTMANTDERQPVPVHRGVHVETVADTVVDLAMIGDALAQRRPVVPIGVTAWGREVVASLRRWLAFHEPASAQLIYIGPPEAAEASGVPAVAKFVRGVARQSSSCILGPAGFAVLDLAAPPAIVTPAPEAGGPGQRRRLELGVRACGDAGPQVARLTELVLAWDAAGRPEAERLRIDAYPAGAGIPGSQGSQGSLGSVHAAAHTTFVVSWL